MHHQKHMVLVQAVVGCGLIMLVGLSRGDLDSDNFRKADNDTPAHGPFALKDAPLNEDGTIEHKKITDKWFILRKSMTWGESVVACQNASAHLIVLAKEEDAINLSKGIAESVTDKFESIEEYVKLFQEVEFGPDRRYWIGLTDQIKEGEWMWVKYGLELVYDFWYPYQPDHGRSGKGEHCVALWNPGYYEETRNTHQFNDESCEHKYYPICGTGKPTY